MPDAGDIYRCEEVSGDPTSGHWWVLVYVGVGEVWYMTATSKVDPFLCTYVKSEVVDPERQPDSAVFIDRNKVVDKSGSPIFTKPTILNCYYSPKRILRQDFDDRVEFSLLERVGHLPDYYLVQIIPSVICSGTKEWEPDDVKQVLHTAHGIGGRVDAFYRALR